jgi:hypothetical protein
MARLQRDIMEAAQELGFSPAVVGVFTNSHCVYPRMIIKSGHFIPANLSGCW